MLSAQIISSDIDRVSTSWPPMNHLCQRCCSPKYIIIPLGARRYSRTASLCRPIGPWPRRYATFSTHAENEEDEEDNNAHAPPHTERDDPNDRNRNQGAFDGILHEHRQIRQRSASRTHTATYGSTSMLRTFVDRRLLSSCSPLMFVAVGEGKNGASEVLDALEAADGAPGMVIDIGGVPPASWVLVVVPELEVVVGPAAWGCLAKCILCRTWRS